MSIDCSCTYCTSACKRNPGWFMPGGAEKAAALLGMPFDEFFKTYLIIDFWCGLDEFDIYAPLKDIGPNPLHSDKMSDTNGFIRDLEGKTRGVPGQRVSWGYGMLEGRCVFLDENDKCKIHAEKPFECREMDHTAAYSKKWPGSKIRHTIALAWKRYWTGRKVNA